MLLVEVAAVTADEGMICSVVEDPPRRELWLGRLEERARLGPGGGGDGGGGP